jgi:hypothetical protein
LVTTLLHPAGIAPHMPVLLVMIRRVS